MIDQYIMKMCLVLSTFGVNILCQRFLQFFLKLLC